MVELPDGKNEDMLSGVHRIPACDRRTETDGQTDGRTSCRGIVCAMHTRHAVKIRPGVRAGPELEKNV